MFLWCAWFPASFPIPANAQEPSSLQAGDLILSTSCRGGFSRATGTGLPSVGAPPITDTAGTLSAGAAVRVAVTLGGYHWCLAMRPNALQDGDVLLRTACRDAGALLEGAWPVVAGTGATGPPLAPGAASTAPVRPPAGKAWCRVAGETALQDGDTIPRTDCRDWTPAGAAPFVQTSGMITDGTTYTFPDGEDEPVAVSGRLWCEV